MTLIDPIRSSRIPLSPIDIGFAQYPNVQPFSPRTAIGYQDQLEGVVKYLTRTLYPFLVEQSGQTVWDGNVDLLIDAVNSIVTGLETYVDTEVATALGEYGVRGEGIDPTGATDSTVGLQAFLNACADGTRVVLAPGAVYTLSNQLTIPHRITLTGSGMLHWVSGVASKECLSVYANGTVIDGIQMKNDVPPLPTGEKQCGIAISASNVTVVGCTVDGFQQGIAVLPFGECYGNLIHYNHVLNVPGSGGGRGSASPAGEDRGDGIVNWGAECSIVGNRVTALAGTDARIGIHTEGLSNLEFGGHGLHSSSLVTIAGNIVSGQFRRAIATEGVSSTSITGNSVADATWWAIDLVGGDGSSCVGNTILWTRTADDNQGAAFAPHRAGIMVYGGGSDTVVANNVIKTVPGSSIEFGIVVEPNGVGTRDGITIDNNMIRDTTNTMYQGITLMGGAGAIGEAKVTNNTIRGFNNCGIYTWNCVDPEVRNNRLLGAGSKVANGIFQDGNGSGAIADGNRIENTNAAIKIVGRNAVSSAQSNMIYHANLGIDYTGTPGPVLTGNQMVDVTAPTKSV